MSDLTFLAPPRISSAHFAAILTAARSPAAPDAAALYAIPVRYGIDPTVALAFFWHESNCGTQGRAVQTLNWGNMRTGEGKQTGSAGGFATYASWADSLEDWCKHILRVYVARGLTTVRQATPVYAPSSDGNAPAAYADAVVGLVTRWQQEEGQVPVAALSIVDFRANLPRKDWSIGTRPGPARYITLHYNGPAVPNQSTAALKQQLINDAEYQMRPGALGAADGGDGLQYHIAIFPDGTIYQCRDESAQLWHCRNQEGNDWSLSVHLPLGGLQDCTEAQWAAFVAYSTDRIARYQMAAPAQSVRAHCEWSQTDCPGPNLLHRLRQWRDGAAYTGGVYHIRPDVSSANVRQAPSTASPVAAVMHPGDTLVADAITMGQPVGGDTRWAHRTDQLGFVHLSLLVPA